MWLGSVPLMLVATPTSISGRRVRLASSSRAGARPRSSRIVGAQVVDGNSGLVEGGVDEPLGLLQLDPGGGDVVLDEALTGAHAVPDRNQVLGDAVVDLGGDPAPLILLGLEGALDYQLAGLLGADKLV